jgi:hypothetical protein
MLIFGEKKFVLFLGVKFVFCIEGTMKFANVFSVSK